MLTDMMKRMTANRIGMVTAKISAHRTLTVKAITIEPRTMNGLRMRSRRAMFKPFCTWLTSSESRVMSVSVPSVSRDENERL